MNFLQTFRLNNYILVFLGFFSLYVAGFLSLPIILLPLLAILLAEYDKTRKLFERVPLPLINAITLLLFFYFFLYTFIFGEDLVAAVIYFTIYLQILKLLYKKRNRDYFQMYILTFTHLTLSTLLTASLLFIIPFLLFIILFPWGFTLYNLKAQLEQAYLGDDEASGRQSSSKEAKRGQRRVDSIMHSRDIATSRFFFATSTVSILLLICTMSVFFAFPRVSFGFLFKQIKSRDMVSGFSDKVDLSTFGQIKTNSAIVMRVETRTNPSFSLDRLYWRGFAYDEYRDKEWQRSSNARETLPMKGASNRVRIRERDQDDIFRYRVLLEALPTKVIFAADKVIELAWDKLRMEKTLRSNLAIFTDPFDALYFKTNLVKDRIYSGQSDLTQVAAKALRGDRQTTFVDHDSPQTYLQLPENLSPRFFTLAEQIVAGVDNNYDRAAAITNHLIENYRYTLEVPAYKDNPIEEFLFINRRGHCEYFATAAVLLLRAVNVPARLVAGFRGGDWNEYGQYIAVRQRHAHTWIEVFFPTYGWQRFDPTPPDNTARDFKELSFAGLRKYYEYIEMRWFKYIVGYSLKMQYRIATGLWERSISSFGWLKRLGSKQGFLGSLLAKLRSSAAANRETSLKSLVLIFLLGIGGIGVAGYVVWQLIQRVRGKNTRYQKDRHFIFYQHYLDLLKSKGVVKKPQQTPLEFNRKVEDRYPDLRDDGTALIRSYYKCRYGGQSLTERDRETIDHCLRKLAKVPKNRASSLFRTS